MSGFASNIDANTAVKQLHEQFACDCTICDVSSNYGTASNNSNWMMIRFVHDKSSNVSDW